jgi:hypothetical protein
MGGIRHSNCGHVGVGKVAVCALWETRILNVQPMIEARSELSEPMKPEIWSWNQNFVQ